MFNSRFNTLLTVLLIVAIVAIFVLMSYLGYSVYNKYYINKKAEDIVDAFEEAVSNNTTNKVTNSTDADNTNIPLIGDVPEGNSIYSSSSTSGSNTKYYGYDVLGTISIPSIDIEYPILEKVTTKAMKVAVGYLCGSRNKSGRKHSYSRT